MSAIKTSLVTGASDGIGRALAAIWRERGESVLGHGRRAVGEAPGFDSASYVQAELAGPDAAQKVVGFLEQNGVQRLDRLVHNAGVGWFGAVGDQPQGSVEELVAVNLMAPIALTLALLPWLQRARGKLVFVSSVIEALPCPDYAVYAATKAALDGLARSLRVELGGDVRVQVVHPGATRTSIHAKAGLPREVADPDRFPSAEATARGIARAVDGNARSVTIGLGNKSVRAIGRQLAVPLDWVQRRRRNV